MPFRKAACDIKGGGADKRGQATIKDFAGVIMLVAHLLRSHKGRRQNKYIRGSNAYG